MNPSPATLVGIFAVIVLLVLSLILWAAALMGGRFASDNKNVPIECGLGPAGTTHPPLPIGFYLIALSFLVFELEAGFLFAWAVAFRTLTWPPILGGLGFVGILALGLFYEWRMGGLAWH